MPTGYTADLTLDSSFRDFACRCARNFGATIMQRDEPLSAPLELPEPSSYYHKAVQQAEQRLTFLRGLSEQEANEHAKADFESACTAYRSRIEERATTRAAYRAMQHQVIDWQPPTKEHEPLRSFMLEQLRESEKWDCDGTYDQPPVQQSGQEWVQEEIAAAQKKLAYRLKAREEEEQRIVQRRTWILQLLHSLPSE